MNALQRIRALIQVQAALGRFQNQIKGQTMKNLLSNWKTTLAGLITLATTVGTSLHFMTVEQASAVMAVAISFGLLAAKDGNVTGGTKQQ